MSACKIVPSVLPRTCISTQKISVDSCAQEGYFLHDVDTLFPSASAPCASTSTKDGPDACSAAVDASSPLNATCLEALCSHVCNGTSDRPTIDPIGLHFKSWMDFPLSSASSASLNASLKASATRRSILQSPTTSRYFQAMQSMQHKTVCEG